VPLSQLRRDEESLGVAMPEPGADP
jgi:hypothetical protein